MIYMEPLTNPNHHVCTVVGNVRLMIENIQKVNKKKL